MMGPLCRPTRAEELTGYLTRQPLEPHLENANRSLILAALLEHPGQMPLALSSRMSLTGKRLRDFLRVWWILADAGHITYRDDDSRWQVTPDGRAWFAEHSSTIARALMHGAIP